MLRSLLLLAALAFAGCGSAGPPLQAESFSNTIWKEVCPGSDPETVWLRLLPDGTFAWTPNADLSEFQHEGDDRWGVVETNLVVTWNDDARTAAYRFRDDPDRMEGRTERTCTEPIYLERVR